MANARATILPPPLNRIRAMAAEAREHQAGVIYSLEVVRTAMVEAAGEGVNTVTIPPGKPVDLRETVAAKATKVALEGEGFRVEWLPQATKPCEPSTYVLTISW